MAFILALLILALSLPCRAETLTLTADKDTYLDQLYPVKNFGQDWDILTSGDANKIARGVFHFNTDMLPEGALIKKARITFLVHANRSTTTYHLHPLTNSWQEDSATWNVAETGRSWATPGGDYDPALSVLASLPASTPNWIVIDLTSLVSNQEGHLKSNIAENGLLLRADTGYNKILSFEFSSYANALTCHSCHGTDSPEPDKGKSTNCASCHSLGGLPLSGEPTLIIDYQPQTLITLASFEALPADRMVTLSWTTESEVDNAGFNIYRSEGGDEYVKVNQEIIAPQGSPTQCATYAFQDTQVENRKTYSYKLEDINIHGKSTFHGPVSATPRLVYTSNRAQVQVATDTSQFRPFSSPPRAVAYGPYSLEVTKHSALIAWEEMDSQETLQHVEVRCSGLSPATEYFYRVNGSTRDGRFLTSPSCSSFPFSFFVWSDTQKGGETAKEVVDRMIAVDPDASFALHAGDLVSDGDSLESWETEWWGPISDLMLYLPIYPAMGNHEAGSDYYYRYFSPLVRQESNSSFDWGGTHIVMFNVVEEDSFSDEHIAWLTDELEKNQNADLTIVCHHTPAYVSSTAVEGETTSLQEILVPLYEQYGVDVVFNGDFHGYQHHLKDGIHYVIAAGGGGKLYDYGLPLEDMTLQLCKSYNFARCQVEGKHLYVTDYSEAGEIIDDFQIVGGHPTSVTSSLAVETNISEVMQGGQFQIDIFLQDIVNLNKIILSLDYSKDDPPVLLKAMDMDTATEGVQIQKGDAGGIVAVNKADNTEGVVSYQEENIAGLSSARVKIASAVFMVPENANITAFYLVPQCTLFDTAGREIPHFMGGAEVVIKPKAATSLQKADEK